MVKKVGKYEIGKTLGEGTFGKVKYAVNTDTHERVAIKVLDKEKVQKQNMGAQIKKEISIMKMVRHRHVVVLNEVLASRTKIFIVLELITGGELFDKIVSEGRFNEATARFYFRQLVDGVQYCHHQGVCHRDLKPENLLLDENGDLKISDFGLSALYEGAGPDGTDGSRASLLHTTCGTPNYVAPEVLADKGYDGRAADVWSIGVILYVLLAGFLPFDEPTMSALFRKIQKAEFSYPKWFTSEAKSMLNQILVPDPETRITLATISNHPWVTEGESTSVGPLANITEPLPSEIQAAAEAAEAVAVEQEATQATAAQAQANDTDTESKTQELAAVEPLPQNPGPEMATTTTSLPELQCQPSQADMDAAIQEGTLVVEEDSNLEEGGLKKMNAFDLINMCGGMALNRMFQSNNNSNTAAVESQDTSTMTNSHNSRPHTQFTSNLPAVDIMQRIKDVLVKFDCDIHVGDHHQYKIKATLQTPKGMVGLIIQIYELAENLHFIEARRGKGDIFEYHKFYGQLSEHLSTLLSPAVPGQVRSREDLEALTKDQLMISSSSEVTM